MRFIGLFVFTAMFIVSSPSLGDVIENSKHETKCNNASNAVKAECEGIFDTFQEADARCAEINEKYGAGTCIRQPARGDLVTNCKKPFRTVCIKNDTVYNPCYNACLADKLEVQDYCRKLMDKDPEISSCKEAKIP